MSTKLIVSCLPLVCALVACGTRPQVLTPEEAAIARHSPEDCEAITIGNVDGQASMSEALGNDPRAIAYKRMVSKAVLMGAAGIVIYDEGIQTGSDVYVVNARAYHCAVPR